MSVCARHLFAKLEKQKHEARFRCKKSFKVTNVKVNEVEMYVFNIKFDNFIMFANVL